MIEKDSKKTENKTASKKEKPKYLVAKEARQNPRRIQMQDKTWVGIGGTITVRAKPPKSGYQIAEATEKQYLEVAERIPHLVQKA